MRTNQGKFKTPYTKKVIKKYLLAINKLIGKSPTYRDLAKIPGPSPRTIIRHFGTWSNALRFAGIRPQTNQLMKGEKTFIRKNWHKMIDKEISKILNISPEIVKYYRMNHNLWKNRKGTSKQKYKSDGLKLYGKNCEVCNLPITELHHIKSKSNNPKDWSILCPTCHAVITRKLITIENREDLQIKLKPFMQKMYKNINLARR